MTRKLKNDPDNMHVNYNYYNNCSIQLISETTMTLNISLATKSYH